MSQNNNISDIFLNYNFNCDSIHAFSTKRGTGANFLDKYSSFNINPFCGDNQNHVESCLNLFCKHLNLSKEFIYLPHQIHEDVIVNIDKSFFGISAKEKEDRLKGVDAVISCLKNVCICVSTADCVPVLIYDPTTKSIAAIHAGWRGIVKRIVEKTLDKMMVDFGTSPNDCLALIGPSISKERFEVGDEVHDLFKSEGFDMEKIASKYPSISNPEIQKWHIDLWNANKIQLLNSGLREINIRIVGICTYDNSDDFFSARKLGVSSGRIITGIVIS